MNDPNGLCVVDGTWHAFYQHNPLADVFGPMHWRHATSTDLVSWTDRGIALVPDELGVAYSGSVVIDHDDTAGFGKGAMVAIHTRHLDRVERQALAVSTDGGSTWVTPPCNPVLASSARDFRDPKVIRLDDRWLMLLAVGDHIATYVSTDLQGWEQTGTVPMPATSAPWECPDLLSLTDAQGAERHLLVACASDLGGHGGTIACAGTFDGSTFRRDADPVLVDHGPEFYALQTFHGLTDRTVGMAWLNSWSTALVQPSAGRRGVLSIPRDFWLDASDRLCSWPAAEVLAHPCVLTGRPGCRVSVEGPSGRAASVAVDADGVVVERWVADAPGMHRRVSVPLTGAGDVCVVVDNGTLEVFADDGRVAVSLQVFAGPVWTLTMSGPIGPDP
jgi:fructan beta-fructosidase